MAGQQQSLVIYTLKSRKDMCQEVEVESGLKEECFKPIREVGLDLFREYLTCADCSLGKRA